MDTVDTGSGSIGFFIDAPSVLLLLIGLAIAVFVGWKVIKLIWAAFSG